MKAIKYGAVWCGPCRQMVENFKEAGIDYTEVDIDEYPDVADTKHITTIPVTEFVDDNKHILKRRVGLISVKDLIEIKHKYEK